MKTFCIVCGTQHQETSYPKKCSLCNTEAYSNPIPVAVVIIPVVGGGIVLERRGIPQGLGELALPSGYMDKGETVEEAATRAFTLQDFEFLELSLTPEKT